MPHLLLDSRIYDTVHCTRNIPESRFLLMRQITRLKGGFEPVPILAEGRDGREAFCGSIPFLF